MKYRLETIPVWEALNQGTECLFCNLMHQAEQRYIDYYLGSSVMNPETRIQVNSTGFCPEHYRALAAAGSPQSMGLLAHTHLEETASLLSSDLSILAENGMRGGGRKAIARIRKLMAERDGSCLICHGKYQTYRRYAYTFAHLWFHDTEFRSAYEDSRGICLHHFPELLEIAGHALKGTALKDFISGMAAKMQSDISDTIDDVHWMTQMYKSENHGKDWRNCQNAQIRAVTREVGSNRTQSEDVHE